MKHVHEWNNPHEEAVHPAMEADACATTPAAPETCLAEVGCVRSWNESLARRRDLPLTSKQRGRARVRELLPRMFHPASVEWSLLAFHLPANPGELVACAAAPLLDQEN